MAGPVYLQGDNKHNFDVIQKHLDTLKEVHGPVYITENAKHSFSEVQKAAEQIKNLNHPVLNTGEAKNHFNQMISSAETLKNMTGGKIFLNVSVQGSSNQMHLKTEANMIWDWLELASNVDILIGLF